MRSKSDLVNAIRGSQSNRLSDRVQHLVNTIGGSTKVTSLLDIGCGDGTITAEIAMVFKIGTVYGADVQPDHPIPQLTHYYQVINNQINLPDHSIDLITCFMSIHHFEQFEPMMNEICRLLKPIGIFFFREHDVPANNHQLIQQLNEKHRQFPDHSGPIHYWSRAHLREILTQRYHFVHMADSDYPPHMHNKQAIYHSSYQYSNFN